ncbi:EamA family transporter [Devosia sp.]|uniref:EamA family transporter n=1 Tax=Devosia sp. TaxID=1871048 RepID=UPI0035B30A35
MQTSMSVRHILLALLVVVLLGLSFIAIRWGVDEVPPLTLTALRYLAAAVPAVVFVRRPQVRLPILLGYGLAIGVGQFGLLFVAIKLGMPAGLSSLVIQLQVFFTIFLAFYLFGERPKPVQVAGALVAFAGIGVIGLARLDGAALLPLLLTIVAAVCWGLGNMASKAAGPIDMLGFVVWSSLVPPIPLLVGSYLLDGPAAFTAILDMSPRAIGSVAFMAWGATLLGFGLWAMLLSRYPANLVAPFALLIPVAGIGSAALLLGETVSGLEIAGSLLVFAGLLLNVFGPRLFPRAPA